MQKHKRKAFKSVTAVLLCFVLLAVSVPITFAWNGTYDPTPVFKKEADRERSVAAWTNNTHGITVHFPQATAQKTNAGVQKTIVFYLLELVDLGDHTDAQTHDVKNLLCKKVETSGNGPYLAEIPAKDILAVLPGGLDADHSYNITVTAVDNKGWMSENLHTVVSDVPDYQFDADAYAPLTTHNTAMREMMTFEAKTSDSYSDYGNGSGSMDIRQTGNTLSFGGRTDQVGVENSSGLDSQGYRFRITGQPSAENPQTFDTAWSRQTWDFSGAQEVWFWLDLSQVSITGLSFQLRGNEKTQTGWADGKTLDQFDQYGDMVYSTTGYTGNDAYVHLLQTDGSWKKTPLQNGTLDLENYRGYIRVPLKFVCSTTASYVDAVNTGLSTNCSGTVKKWNWAQTNTAMNSYINSNLVFEPVLVDPAGTPVSDALLLQGRNLKCQPSLLTDNPVTCAVGTKMLATGLSKNEVLQADNGKRATITDGIVSNRENGYKVLEDLFSAGFSYTGVSADSVDKSFFLDNILFYRTDGGAYSENTLNNNPNTGNPVTDYYDQTVEIAHSIFNQIELYISDPDWGDYRAVAYIEDLINGYKDAYSKTDVGAAWLEEAALERTAATLYMTDVWQRFITARKLCTEAGTYGKNNAEADALVPELERTLEKLPEPSSLISVSDELKTIITHLHQVYARLNLGQLDALGIASEQKLLDYFILLQEALSTSMVVGQALTNNPFIPFNTFENTTNGTRAWQLENDTNAGSVNTDYRYTKGLLTFTTTFESFAGRTNDTLSGTVGSVPSDPTQNGFGANTLRQNAAWGIIGNNGFKDSLAPTITLDSQYYSAGLGLYNVLSVTYQGAEEDNYGALRAHNTGADTIKLGGLAKAYSGTGSMLPLSLIFYVDFTELSKFRMAVTISTYTDGKPDDYILDMGSKASDRVYYLLDPDTGEWVSCQSAPMYAFRSYDSASNGLNMDNYKGYVMIPLYHFKRGPVVNNWKLDETAQSLNSIYRVSIGIAPDDPTAAASMDGKSYTIDNIGFGFEKEPYVDVVASRGIQDKTFDEVFDAKSLPAEQFEQAVNSIDPYNLSALSFDISNVEPQYDILGSYQKTLSSVVNAKNRLEAYKNHLNGSNPLPSALIGAPATLSAEIAALPEAVRTASVIGSNDLPYPGFTTDTGSGEAIVNYAAYGITPEQAENIIMLYEQSYKRYSAAQKAMVTNSAELITAYNAARRCKNLETMLADMRVLKAQIVNIYTQPVDADRYIELQNRDTIAGIFNAYKELEYSSKALITDGSFDSSQSNFRNIPAALEKLLKNTKVYTTTDNEQISGGILQLQALYRELYDMANAHINIEKTLFSAEELALLKETLEEYNAFLGIYHNIYDLKTQIDAILALFTFNPDDAKFATDEVLLTSSAAQGTAEFHITYSEKYPIPADSGEQYSLKVRTDKGVLGTTLAGDTAAYNLNILGQSYNAANLSGEGSALLPGVVSNNTSTPQTPQVLDIKVSFPDGAPVTSYTLSDTIYVDFTDTDGTVLQTYSVPVSYSMEESYTIVIPAEIPVSWDDTGKQNVSYRVTSALNVGSKLFVGVSGSTAEATGKLTRTDTGYYLPYTKTNFITTEFTGINSTASPANEPAIQVSGFSSVPVSEYKDILTYQVEYQPNS